ncbi:hypothetical protein AH156_19655 [Salmonella enterica subsp. enterica serovar Enteritidis]|nr:hypothetical protein [Salmonella enterica subsp. enterica serovar Enteritidis]
MADKMEITFDWGSTWDLLEVINKQSMPYMNAAVNAVGMKLAATWVEEVQKAKLWSVEKDQYAQSIKWQMTGDFSGYVEASYKWAKDIEEGRPARDLKRMLGTSLKVRRTKKGARFLVIPFRHNIKKMPPELYAQAKALEASTVTGMTQRRSGEIVGFGMKPAKVQSHFLSNPKTRGPMMVQQAQYKWGGRIAAGFFGPNPKGKTDIAAGMVRFDTSSGGQKSSAYMTFRVMSEKSQGWIVPPQPGQFLARKALDKVKPQAEKLFGQAVAAFAKKGGNL